MANPSRAATNVIPGFNIDFGDVAAPSSIPDLTRPVRENLELITDLARFSETLLSESAVRRKWRLAEKTWEALGSDDELVRAVEEEKTRRVCSGALKRELAQQHVVRGPNVLATIMDDPRANARHRVDSVKALNAIADPGPEAAAEQEHIVIRIDLGADLRAKGQEPNPGDVIIIDAGVPKPQPIDGWDTFKRLGQENASPRRSDDD